MIRGTLRTTTCRPDLTCLLSRIECVGSALSALPGTMVLVYTSMSAGYTVLVVGDTPVGSFISLHTSAATRVFMRVATNPSMLRVAVVGAGSIGREFSLCHFGSKTRTVVSSIVDIDARAAERLAIDVGSIMDGAKVVGVGYQEEASEMRGTPLPHATSLTADVIEGCDAVYIAATPSAHRDLVLQALASGKHVLLEKPLAATPQDADAIVEAAEAAIARGVHTSMNIGMRYNTALHRMQTLAVELGKLGELSGGRLGLHFAAWPREWQRASWCAGRTEGGPCREVGTHFFFALHDLFGHGCVRRVRASTTYADRTDASLMAETAVDGVLELANGLRIALSVSTDGSVSGPDADLYSLVLTGSEGALELDSFTCLKQLGRRKRTLVRDGGYGRTECVEAFVATACAEYPYAVATSPVTVREGRNAQRVLDAILGSHGEWVEVKYD